jgi:hypothetical protein
MRPLVLSSPHEPAVADDARVASGTVGAGTRGVSPCHSLCHSIGEKCVATGSHGLDESVLFALLTHQLKVTDCNGLDGSDHPLKVKTRVRTPYGLPARIPRSAATFGANTIAPEAAAATHFATQSGPDSVRTQHHVGGGSTRCAAAMPLG